MTVSGGRPLTSHQCLLWYSGFAQGDGNLDADQVGHDAIGDDLALTRGGDQDLPKLLGAVTWVALSEKKCGALLTSQSM
jgi:hypothetical protein